MSSASPSDRPAHTGPAAGRLPAGPDATAASSPARRFHISGLDALRAIAVLAVVVYHVDPGLLPGGFLGVDVFFVVSGFLITTLLLRERARTGGSTCAASGSGGPGACCRRCSWSSPCAARRPCWAARICGCTWTGRSSAR